MRVPEHPPEHASYRNAVPDLLWSWDEQRKRRRIDDPGLHAAQSVVGKLVSKPMGDDSGESTTSISAARLASIG